MVVLEKSVAKAASRNPKRGLRRSLRLSPHPRGEGGRVYGLTPVVQENFVQFLFPISKLEDFGPTRKDAGSIFSVSAFNRSARTSTNG
jgi:hypothetical protein